MHLCRSKCGCGSVCGAARRVRHQVLSVLQNMQELQRAAAQQQQQSEQLLERLVGLQDNQDGLDKRIKDASQVWLPLGIAT